MSEAIALEEVPDEARGVDLAGDEPGPVWRSVRAGPGVPSVGDAIQLNGDAVTTVRVSEPGDILAHWRRVGPAPAAVDACPGLQRDRDGVAPAQVAVAEVGVHDVLLAMEGEHRHRALRLAVLDLWDARVVGVRPPGAQSGVRRDARDFVGEAARQC